ncbi:MAG: ZIP family metal transporter [Akkermansiaceae bacterium]|nr:ZIP family metal transporter [Akkermansiaceae bacterium]
MELLLILSVAWAAGLTALLGGFLACLEGSGESQAKRELIHGVVAFGGGVLLAAVAFALTPHGIKELPPWGLALSFVAGGIVFCGVDAWISRQSGSKAQLMALLLDYLPEALALGALFSKSREAGLLLALFIGMQNLPEGFNAHRENTSNGMKKSRSLVCLLVATLLGPLAAFCGHAFLGDQEVITAAIMCFAAGGILYLVFQDIAPQATMKRHWLPPLGAVLGFVLGMFSKQLIG